MYEWFRWTPSFQKITCWENIPDIDSIGFRCILVDLRQVLKPEVSGRVVRVVVRNMCLIAE